MTLREKLQIEHPECIDEKWHGGCKDCPHQYGYKKMEECECDSKTVTDEICRKCWDQKYEGELTPQEKMIERLTRESECTKDLYMHRNNQLEKLRSSIGDVLKHVGCFSGPFYITYPDELCSKLNDTYDNIQSSRNRWRAAFIGLLFGNAIAFILQLLI